MSVLWWVNNDASVSGILVVVTPQPSNTQELWQVRPKPTPLYLATTLPNAPPTDANDPPTAGGPSAARALGLTDSHAHWSTADNARVFVSAVTRFLTQRAAEVGAAVFDKDDDLAVEVVTAAANLRAASYGIPTASLFEIKVGGGWGGRGMGHGTWNV